MFFEVFNVFVLFRFKEMPKIQPRSLMMLESNDNMISSETNLIYEYQSSGLSSRPVRGRRGKFGGYAAMGGPSRQGVILQYFSRLTFFLHLTLNQFIDFLCYVLIFYLNMHLSFTFRTFNEILY